MKKVLVQEHIILDKEMFDTLYADARKKGVLIIKNERGRAEMSTGIYMLNGIPDFSKDHYQIKHILYGLIMKYRCFYFTPKRFEKKMLCYLYIPENKTWSSFNLSK